VLLPPKTKESGSDNATIQILATLSLQVEIKQPSQRRFAAQCCEMLLARAVLAVLFEEYLCVQKRGGSNLK